MINPLLRRSFFQAMKNPVRNFYVCFGGDQETRCCWSTKGLG